MDSSVRTYNELCVWRFVTVGTCCCYNRYSLDLSLFGNMVFSIWCIANNLGTDIGNNVVYVLSRAEIPGLHVGIRRILSRPQWPYIHLCSYVFDSSHLTVSLGLLGASMFLILVYERHISVES